MAQCVQLCVQPEDAVEGARQQPACAGPTLASPLLHTCISLQGPRPCPSGSPLPGPAWGRAPARRRWRWRAGACTAWQPVCRGREGVVQACVCVQPGGPRGGGGMCCCRPPCCWHAGLAGLGRRGALRDSCSGQADVDVYRRCTHSKPTGTPNTPCFHHLSTHHEINPQACAGSTPTSPLLHPCSAAAPPLLQPVAKAARPAFLPAARAKLGEGASEEEVAAESLRLQNVATGA
jgi:hypothetical protein